MKSYSGNSRSLPKVSNPKDGNMTGWRSPNHSTVYRLHTG
jgi:hypothetical protein